MDALRTLQIVQLVFSLATLVIAVLTLVKVINLGPWIVVLLIGLIGLRIASTVLRARRARAAAGAGSGGEAPRQ